MGKGEMGKGEMGKGEMGNCGSAAQGKRTKFSCAAKLLLPQMLLPGR